MTTFKLNTSSLRGPRVSRRGLLRGALLGGASSMVALPLLESMLNTNGTALADGSSLPQRLGVFFWGNGVHPERWKPVTLGAGWSPNEQTAPLAALTDRITVVSGMDNFTAGTDGHEGGAGLLTGHHAQLISDSPKNIAPTSESFDQLAGRSIGAGTKFQSLQLRISKAVLGQGILYAYTSWSNASSPIEGEGDPRKLYDRLFSGFQAPGATPVLDQTLALRRSVLDTVKLDLAALRANVGASDQARLDEHFTHLRSIEKRLESAPTLLSANCLLPGVPSELADDNDEGQELLAPRMLLMSQLLGMALACDLTRVFTLQLTGAVALTRYPIPGFNQDQHALTHEEGGDQPLVHRSILHNMEQFATLVTTLDAIAEGPGKLLDNCAILATSDCSEGRSHSQKDYPIMLAGTAGGRLRRGVHLNAPGENTNKLVFSLLNAVGCNITEFGEQSASHQARVTEGLAALEA